nr:dnaJ protein ERDJ3A [Quercus suber]POF18948.1 dnaj protein erdj3a [Quercus suber]
MTRLPFLTLLLVSLFVLTLEAKTKDLYKVLGVEKTASQREIQKAFHKLSLQYHPDKNKNKGAQEKFAEINNAYDILSDEEKRKNYDMYGDEKASPRFDAGYSQDNDGYTYFTSGGGGPGHGQNTFRPGEWQSMGGSGGFKSFSFSFGGSGGPGSFGFGLNDIFSNFFGGDTKGWGQFGGFGGSTRSQSGPRSSSKNIRTINSQVFQKEITEQGMTWLLFSYTPSLKGNQHIESILEEVASTLQGALQVGSINCETEVSFCKDLGIYPRRAPRVFIYSYISSDKGSLVEYNGELAVQDLKSFCQEHLPRFSKRVDLRHFEFPSVTSEKLPRVILLSTRKDTPVIWRVLSGLYHKRFILYDAQVQDVTDPTVRRLGVDALPAIVGWLSNGEKHVLKTGISVKDIKSAVNDLSILLDGFEKKNKKEGTRKAKTSTEEKQIPLLTGSNFDALCGESTPVCIIGAFRSSRAREKLESILSMVSQKSLTRRQSSAFGSRDSISYTLLDATKQSAFLNAFDKAGFKSVDKLLVAYKPRKTKFASFVGEMTTEEVERFIGSVLNGDIQFRETRKKPVLKQES